jgi:hypothetical protein
MEPHESFIDPHVAKNTRLKSILLSSAKTTPQQHEIDFFNVLQKRYQPLGIKVSWLTHKKDIERSLESLHRGLTR